MRYFTTTVDLKDSELDHSIYVQCLQLRREVFISQMGWNLYQHMGCEFDQYDTPASVHVVALQNNAVLGCMRLLRTDNDLGNATYMILDAHLGRIPNLPSGIMDEQIQSQDTWEASRLAISSRVPTSERNAVLVDLLRTGMEYVATRGGTSLLGMMNPVFLRVFRRAGLRAYKFGRIADQRDGRLCVMKLDLEPGAAMVAA